MSVQAEEALTSVINVMSPHISKQDRQKLIESYRRIMDGEQEASSAIIKRDRERLRKLFSRK